MQLPCFWVELTKIVVISACLCSSSLAADATKLGDREQASFTGRLRETSS